MSDPDSDRNLDLKLTLHHFKEGEQMRSLSEARRWAMMMKASKKWCTGYDVRKGLTGDIEIRLNHAPGVTPEPLQGPEGVNIILVERM